MKKWARKSLSLVLTISFLVTLFPVFPSYINSMDDGNQPFEIEYDTNDVGWLTFETYVRTGSTSSVRYRTIGVQVEWLEKGYKTLVRLREDQAEQIPDPNNPGYVTFRFRVPFVRANADPKTVGEPAFWNHSVLDNFVWEYRDQSNADAVKRDVLNFFFTGGNVRFDAIMTIVPPGSTSPKGSINYQARFSDPKSVKYTNPNDVYETLEGIQGAAPWSNPSDLEQYFEIIRYLNPQPISGSVISRYFEVRGNTVTAILSDEVQTNHDLRQGNPNTFPGTYKDFGEDRPFIGVSTDEKVTFGSTINKSSLIKNPNYTVTLTSDENIKIINYFYEYEEKEEYDAFEIEPDPWTMKVGDTRLYSAKARIKGTSEWVTIPNGNVTWSSVHPTIATIDATGLARGVTKGTTTIRGTWNGLTDTAALIVEESPLGLLDGDFIIDPNTITFREPFTLIPTEFTIPDGCVYTGHSYRFSNGGYAYSDLITSETASTRYSYSNYPSVIDVGTVYISIKINADCENHGTITTGYIKEKPLTVIGIRDNQGPIFEAGWFDPYQPNRTRANRRDLLVIGYRYDLGIVIEDHENPNLRLPRDPEGDYPITYTWNFLGSDSEFIRSIHDTFGDDSRELYQGIQVPNDPELKGTRHTVEISARDRFGTPVTTRTVSVEIVGPEPIAVCTGTAEVKSGRPFKNTFSISGSFSPVGRSVTVDRWEGIDQLVNHTDKPIIKYIQLYVRDSAGLISAPANCPVTVLPDQPPIAKLNVPPLSVRGNTVDVLNQSYSVDGDIITSITYKMKYDANNNGFADDPWQTVQGDLNKFSFKPSKVGKYLFYAEVCEDYGACGDTSWQEESSLILDVVNREPEVSFSISGNNPDPIPPAPPILASNILRSWELYETNSVTKLPKTYWYDRNGALYAGMGRGMERQYKYYSSAVLTPDRYGYLTTFTDAGYGPNNITPYKAMVTRDTSRSQPVLLPFRNNQAAPYTQEYDTLKPATFGHMFRTNQKYLYFDAEDYIWAFNKSRIPTYETRVQMECTQNSCHSYREHRWTDGKNPYDFAILVNETYFDYSYQEYRVRMPAEHAPEMTVPLLTQQDYRSGKRHHSTPPSEFSGTEKAKVIGHPTTIYEVAEDVIYVLYSYQIPEYCYWWEHDEDGWRHDCRYSNNYPGVLVYDAFTGELLGKTDMTKPAMEGMANVDVVWPKGDNLVAIKSGYSSSSEPGTFKYMEFDRTGAVVKSGTHVLPNTGGYYERKYKNWAGNIITQDPKWFHCTWTNVYGPQAYWKDDKGNFYTYASMECVSEDNLTLDRYLNPEAPVGLYLIKITPELQFQVLTRMGGTSIYHGQLGFNQNTFENNPIMVINNAEGVAYTRTFHIYTCSGCHSQSKDVYYETVNLTTGEITEGPVITEQAGNMTNKFHIRPDGSTASGWCTYTVSGTCAMHDWHHNTELEYMSNNAGVNRWRARNLQHGQYIGDGIFLSFYQQHYEGGGGGVGQGWYTDELYMFIDVGTVNNNEAFKPNRLGQFVSPSEYENVTVSFAMKVREPAADQHMAGFSFLMQDPRNRYAVETDGKTMYLSRYSNGSRTVLQSVAWELQSDRIYHFKIKFTASSIRLDIDNVPVFEYEGTLQRKKGKIGPFTDKSFVTFAAINVKQNVTQDIWISNYAIWDPELGYATVKYENIRFTDPENDPRAGTYRWRYTHTPKFMNHQGLSMYHNKTFDREQLIFDKVGVYEVELTAYDDPHPDYRYPNNVFDEYRKRSNPYRQTVIVHRRPIAVAAVSVNEETGVVTWSKTTDSYDPDRWVNASTYSPPDTPGMNYRVDKGIKDERYYYVTPSGQVVEGKLTHPQEEGIYVVYYQVMDEYGAWSEYWEGSVQVSNLPDNAPPAAVMVYPSGTQSNPTLETSRRPVLRWNQTDPDPGTVFTKFQLQITNESNVMILDSGERPQNTTAATASWTPNVDLPTGQKLRVRVRVFDGTDWSEWSAYTWMFINNAPKAVITDPSGTQANPTVVTTLRPTITWNQTDPDPNTVFEYYEVEIINEANTWTVARSGQVRQNTSATTNSWTPSTDLPAGQKLKVRVRVSDGRVWSEWSSYTWFIINRPPTVTITYPTGTQANPTVVATPRPTITWNQTDPDPNTVFEYYEVEIINEANTWTVAKSGQVRQNTSATSNSWTPSTDVPAGQKLKVRVRVHDGYVWSAWSNYTWFRVNRPPVADFTWSPNPVWEGDTLTLTNTSTDPDGDPLTYTWKITGPGGYSKTVTLQHASVPGADTSGRPGPWTVSLTVRDPYGAEDTAVKVITVGDLSVTGQVRHTPEWESYRQTWNTKNPTKQRAVTDFWAGEAFVLSAAVTDTRGSATAPQQVTATLLATGDEAVLSSRDQVNFDGELVNPDYAKLLSDGPYTFRFRAVWNNGHVEEDDVVIHIVGDIYDVIVNQQRL